MVYAILVLTTINTVLIGAVLTTVYRAQKTEAVHEAPRRTEPERRMGRRSRLSDAEQFEYLMNYTGEAQADE